MRFNTAQQAVAAAEKQLGNRIGLHPHSISNDLHTFTPEVTALHRIALAFGQHFKALLKVALTTFDRGFLFLRPLCQRFDNLIRERDLLAATTGLVAMLKHLVAGHLESPGAEV